MFSFYSVQRSHSGRIVEAMSDFFLQETILPSSCYFRQEQVIQHSPAAVCGDAASSAMLPPWLLPAGSGQEPPWS